MATIIVKRSSSEKPKDDAWRYVKAKFETDILFCHYNKSMDEWHDADLTIHTDNISFWLEEVELPSDEKIKTMTIEYDFSNELIFKAFYRGAQRVRDEILKK